MTRQILSALTLILLSTISLSTANLWGQSSDADRLHQAAKAGQLDVVSSLLENGIDVNAESEYGATALSFASQHGHVEIVRLLLDRGAKVDIRDRFYKVTPLQWAAGRGHADVVAALSAGGAKATDDVLARACAANHAETVGQLLRTGTFSETTLSDLLITLPEMHEEVRARLIDAGGDPKRAPTYVIDAAELAGFEGTYTAEDGQEVRLVIRDSRLDLFSDIYRQYVLEPAGGSVFRDLRGRTTAIPFHYRDGKVVALTLGSQRYARLGDRVSETMPSVVGRSTAEVTHPMNWPGFRGNRSSGIADGQHPPLDWDIASGVNVRWKFAVDGLGHACPIVWEDRVFLTTAVSGSGDHSLRTGQYGDVDSVEDESEHHWMLICLDKESGNELWTQAIHRGVPQVKRHLKSTHANPTPVTDGTHVVVALGSEGLFCFDFDGELVWKRDLGKLASGWFYDDALEWGFGSSPILYEDSVILQCDVGKGSFIAAYKLKTGQEIWRTPRDEIPSWSTPAIHFGDQRDELITAATNFVRAYDPRTGEEFWRMSGMSEVQIPTPVVTDDLVYVVSGYQKKPLFAIRPGGSGDISLQGTEDSNDFVVWSLPRGGPYMPTPLVYDGLFYVCPNNGVLACYDASTGERLYRKRLGGRGGYTASLVAADGVLYAISEQGDVHLIRTGDEFELVNKLEMGETCMSTPAISDGMLFIRTQHHLFALGER